MMNAQALAYATASLRSLAKAFDPGQPRDDHGRWTDAGGNTSSGADRPSGYRVDNPGGQWLREQQEEAYYGQSKTAQKGLRGTQTAWAGYDQPLMLPVSDLSTLGGVNDEVRAPGDPQFDRLIESVQKNGYTNEDPVMVFVNHHGRAYVNEGNTRIAVAKATGVDRIKTWVAWYNGGEQAAGDWTPADVARMERGEKAFDPSQPRAPAGQSNGGRWVGASDAGDFDTWFAGSVVVNADGTPKVVYHQTSVDAEREILAGGYELGHSLALGSDDEMPNGVFFSTTSQDLGLATAEDNKRTIIPTYLAVKNPLRVKNRDELGDFLSKDEEWLRLHDEVNALDRQIAADYDKFERETFSDKTLTREDISRRLHEAGAALDAGSAKTREIATVARVRSTAIIRAAGYDGVWMQDDQGGLFGRKHITTIVALHPKAARPVASVRPAHAKAFDPGQPRAPEGSSIGGRWVSAGNALGTEISLPTQRKIKLSKEARAVSDLDLLDQKEPAQEHNSRRINEIAKELDERTHAALKKMGVRTGKLDGPGEHDEMISQIMAAEVQDAIGRAGVRNSRDWYSHKVDEAIGVIAEEHPEVLKDRNARAAFSMALSVVSQGETVNGNARLADEAYTFFAKNKRFPTDMLVKNSDGINGNFKKLNKLIDEMGFDGTRDFLSKQFTAGELKRMGFTSAEDFLVDAKVYGSAILGAKVGQGFYQNLMGNYEPVTFDRWFMRGYNRVTGRLYGAQVPKTAAGQRLRLETELKNAGEKVPRTSTSLDRVAKEITSAHEKDFTTNRALYDSGKREKSQLVYAAERYAHGRSGINQEPKSAGDRAWITDRVYRSVEILKEHGLSMTPADFQAAWWYPEKQLYDKLGGRDSDGINIDYATAFRNYYRKTRLLHAA